MRYPHSTRASHWYIVTWIAGDGMRGRSFATLPRALANAAEIIEQRRGIGVQVTRYAPGAETHTVVAKY
jgi:hypothetical protein